MAEDTSKSRGVVSKDAMIARAEAYCEQGRSALDERLGTSPLIVRRRRARLQVMEHILARLKAERKAGTP
jgi:hypothetical protein